MLCALHQEAVPYVHVQVELMEMLNRQDADRNVLLALNVHVIEHVCATNALTHVLEHVEMARCVEYLITHQFALVHRLLPGIHLQNAL